MKKLTAFLLAAILTLSLTACGGGEGTSEGGDMTKEELLAVAEERTAEETNEDIDGNEAKANTYIDQIFVITGKVVEISSEYCVVMAKASGSNSIIHFENGERYNAEFCFHVHFPEETLAELQNSTNITFVGVISGVGSEEYGVADRLYLDVTNPYLV